MRKPIIAGNWKMNKTPYEAARLMAEICQKDLDDRVEAVVCVPAIDLSVVSEAIAGRSIGLGAQNMYFEKSGAFTGEISAEMLCDLGVKYVILGHSERREYFYESDELIAKKIRAALASGLRPILCVGETLAEREGGAAQEKVARQLKDDLTGLSAEDFSEIVIAYEPIWAIGTGKTASAEDAEEMCRFIRENIRAAFGSGAAEAVRIQYGGSVKPENVQEIMSKENIDGALVGGASLKADSFAALVNYR